MMIVPLLAVTDVSSINDAEKTISPPPYHGKETKRQRTLKPRTDGEIANNGCRNATLTTSKPK